MDIRKQFQTSRLGPFASEMNKVRFTVNYLNYLNLPPFSDRFKIKTKKNFNVKEENFQCKRRKSNPKQTPAREDLKFGVKGSTE